MKKFLIINPFGIGDVLFTTPLIRAIKDKQPDSIIGYWCNERVRGILKNNSGIDKIFALSRGDLKKIYQKSKWGCICQFLNLVYKIKKANFDISLDVSLDHRYSLICKLAGIKKRIGFNFKKRGRFLTDKIDIAGYQDRHVVEYYLDLLRLLNINAQDKKLELFVTEQNKKQAVALLDSKGIDKSSLLVGIAPGAGASWGSDAVFKHWPAIKFAQLADKMIENLGARVLILGDEQEKQISEIIANAMKHKAKAIDLTGETNLEGLSAVINNLGLLVTNDGGPLHIAVAQGIKTVSIFGPVDDKVYGPYPASDKHIVIREDVECRPCYNNFRFTGCLNNRRCIEDVSVDKVYSTVQSLI